MDENKDKTVKFDPIREEIIHKEEISRQNDDIYSKKRKSSAHDEYEDEKSNNTLMYVAIALAVVLIIVIVAGFFVLGSSLTKNEPQPKPEIENEEVISGEEKEPEKEEEEIKEDVIIKNAVVFYGDSVIKKENGYSVLADIYDNTFKKIDHRKIFIDKDTKIYENGKRMSAEGFIYTIESLVGEMIIVHSEINDKDGHAISLVYESGFEIEEKEEAENTEETQEEEKNTQTEEETPSENNEASVEETEESSVGIVVE